MTRRENKYAAAIAARAKARQTSAYANLWNMSDLHSNAAATARAASNALKASGNSVEADEWLKKAKQHDDDAKTKTAMRRAKAAAKFRASRAVGDDQPRDAQGRWI